MKKILVVLGSIIAGLIIFFLATKNITPQKRAGETAKLTPTLSPSPSPSAAKILTAGILKGVSMSPKSYQPADFTEFFMKAKKAGTLLTWAGNAAEFADQNGAPWKIQQIATQFGLEPVMIAGVADDYGGADYKDSLAVFAKKYKPEYIGFGNEVNRLPDAAFAKFVPAFANAAKAIKAASPQTKVFVVFNLETLKGLNGGLFGGTNDPAAAKWELLARFPDADLFAFTTYPGLIYKDPADIPAEYYAELASHTGKPVVITEVAWFRTGPGAGWESSQTEQAAFIRRFFGLMKPVRPAFVIWPFVYDPPVGKPFDTMGLIPKDGSEGAAWAAWLEVK